MKSLRARRAGSRTGGVRLAYGTRKAGLLDWLVLILFAAILASLATALGFLLRSKGGSRGVVGALTVRIALSVALFLLLMLAWYAGLIEPHGIQPAGPPAAR